MKRALTKREKLIIYTTLGIFLVSLTFSGLLQGYAKLSALNQDIANKTALLRRHFQLVKKGGDIRSLYESYRSILESEGSAQELDTHLFNEMKDFAATFNLTIERVKPLPVELKKEYAQVSLEVEIVGDFRSIFQLINELENSPSFIKVLSLRLSQQSAGSQLLRCRLTLSRLFFS
ncbi:MAG: type 4a pilus biogenesis protein PilO [Candidatus Omnitrophota bacterium]|nr:MAG: type 4a pilus biogenesis protein PilO [Candidatus Omnitrophota bacterium]